MPPEHLADALAACVHATSQHPTLSGAAASNGGGPGDAAGGGDRGCSRQQPEGGESQAGGDAHGLPALPPSALLRSHTPGGLPAIASPQSQRRVTTLGEGDYFGDGALGFAYFPESTALFRTATTLYILAGPDIDRHVSAPGRNAMLRRWAGQVEATAVGEEMSARWQLYKNALVREVLYQRDALATERAKRLGFGGLRSRSSRDHDGEPASGAHPSTLTGALPADAGWPHLSAATPPCTKAREGRRGSRDPPLAFSLAPLRGAMVALGMDAAAFNVSTAASSPQSASRPSAASSSPQAASPAHRLAPSLSLSPESPTPSPFTDHRHASSSSALSDCPSSGVTNRSRSGSRDGRPAAPAPAPSCSSEVTGAVDRCFESLRQLAPRLPQLSERFVEYYPAPAVLVAKITPVGATSLDPLVDAGILDTIQEAWARLAARRGLLSLRHHHSVFVVIAPIEPPLPPPEPGKPMGGQPLRESGPAAAAAALLAVAVAMRVSVSLYM